MLKNDLVRVLAQRMGDTEPHCRAMLDELLDILRETFASGRSVRLNNFGRFIVQETSSGRHVVFRPADKLGERAEGGRNVA